VLKQRKPTYRSVLAICSFVHFFLLLPVPENQLFSTITKSYEIFESTVHFECHQNQCLLGPWVQFPCCLTQRTRCCITADALSLSSAAAFWAEEFGDRVEICLFVCLFVCGVGWFFIFSVRLSSFFFFIYDFKHVICPAWWGLRGYS